MKSRILALACAGVCAATAASAQGSARDQVLAGVARCGVIQDDRVWLECVYGAQQPMRSRLSLPPAPEFQQRLVPPATTANTSVPPALQASARPQAKSAATSRRRPGFFESLVGDPPPYAQSRMRSVRYERSGAFIVTLENGQEWRQTDAEGGQASFPRAPSDYTVTITSGSFNSYTMRTSNGQRRYRVERAR
ncbi:MAG: hypothetical protein V4601_00325 [Pseudomonadota bacterium]